MPAQGHWGGTVFPPSPSDTQLEGSALRGRMGGKPGQRQRQMAGAAGAATARPGCPERDTAGASRGPRHT